MTPLGIILLIVLVLLLVGGLPPVGWYGHPYGYAPSGLLGTVLIIVLVLILLGRI